MFKKKLIIIALLLLAGTSAWAQRDYRKGYIINNQQDTIYGWIDYRGDIRNAKICSFKETETGQATDYSPTDIAAYRFTDSKFYVSRNIDNADDPKQVFLEYLVNGLANLYYYRDDRTNDNYFIEKDGQLLELKVTEREVEVDGKLKIQTVKTYVGVLRATLNVWDMNNEIDKAKLEHSSLINIAKNYHMYSCTDGSECIVYEKRKPLLTLRISPVVGANLSVLKKMERDVEKYQLKPSSNLTVGMNLNLSIPRMNEKLFLQIQALYSKYYFFDSYESTRMVTDIHISSIVLQTGLAIKYEYPKGRWRPTLSIGAATIWLPNGSIEEITDNYDYTGAVRPSTVINDFPNRFFYGFEFIPGIHYYLTPKRIVFMQMQYLQCFNREHANHPPNQIRSFGLSAGIYF